MWNWIEGCFKHSIKFSSQYLVSNHSNDSKDLNTVFRGLQIQSKQYKGIRFYLIEDWSLRDLLFTFWIPLTMKLGKIETINETKLYSQCWEKNEQPKIIHHEIFCYACHDGSETTTLTSAKFRSLRTSNERMGT